MNIRRVLLGLFCLLMLTGCTMKAKMSDVTETTVGINSDGSVTEVMLADFNENYYSVDDLEAFVRERINNYNDAYDDSEPVTMTALEQTESSVRLEVAYATSIDYAQFNRQTFRFASLSQMLEDSDFTAATDFTDLSGQSVVVSELGNADKLRVLYVENSMVIRTSGKVVAVSSGCEILDDNTVRTADGPCAIIFKGSLF